MSWRRFFLLPAVILLFIVGVGREAAQGQDITSADVLFLGSETNDTSLDEGTFGVYAAFASNGAPSLVRLSEPSEHVLSYLGDASLHRVAYTSSVEDNLYLTVVDLGGDVTRFPLRDLTNALVELHLDDLIWLSGTTGDEDVALVGVHRRAGEVVRIPVNIDNPILSFHRSGDWAFAYDEGAKTIEVYNLATYAIQQTARINGLLGLPAWSPNQPVYAAAARTDEGEIALVLVNVVDGGRPQHVIESASDDVRDIQVSWSYDGNFLSYTLVGAEG
jgi:hypothetical protein